MRLVCEKCGKAGLLLCDHVNDRHRGWLIEQNWTGWWGATHPDYDPTPIYPYDGPSDHRHVIGKTRDEVIAEIDAFIEENEE